MKNTVFSYWEGPKPPVINLCFETMLKHVPNICIFDKESFFNIYDNSFVKKDCLKNQCHPNINSNFVRAWLLYTYGGMWFDADCIILRNPYFILDYLQNYDFVTYVSHRVVGCSALIASKPKGYVITNYLCSITHRLNNNMPMPKKALRPKKHLTPFVRRFRDKCYFIPKKNIHQIPLWKIKRRRYPSRLIMEDASDEEFARFNHDDNICFMLSGNIVKAMSHLNREELMSGTSLMARFFRQSLEV